MTIINDLHPTTTNKSPSSVPTSVPTYIVAVPVYHENLYQIIKDNEKWLTSQSHPKNKVMLKKINTEEDFEKLENIIKALRTEKSELFIDPEYHPMQQHAGGNVRLEEYVAEFIKNKSVGTHYTYKSFYSITVYPFNFDYNSPVPTGEIEKIRYMDIVNQRKEYLIIPLYIILKKGKTYEQMKMLSYNPDGSYNVHDVNPKHFYKPVLDDQEEIHLKNKEIREKAVVNAL